MPTDDKIYQGFKYNIGLARHLLLQTELSELKKELAEALWQRLDERREEIRTKIVDLMRRLSIFGVMPMIAERMRKPRTVVGQFVKETINVLKEEVRVIFRKEIDEHFRISSNIFQQQAIVLAATALEAYLRHRYLTELHNHNKDKVESELPKFERTFQSKNRIKEFYSQLSHPNISRILGTFDSPLWEDVEITIQMRHVITHRAGNLGKNSCEIIFRRNQQKIDLWSGRNIQELLNTHPHIVEERIRSVEKFVSVFDENFAHDT